MSIFTQDKGAPMISNARILEISVQIDRAIRARYSQPVEQSEYHRLAGWKITSPKAVLYWGVEYLGDYTVRIIIEIADNSDSDTSFEMSVSSSHMNDDEILIQHSSPFAIQLLSAYRKFIEQGEDINEDEDDAESHCFSFDVPLDDLQSHIDAFLDQVDVLIG